MNRGAILNVSIPQTSIMGLLYTVDTLLSKTDLTSEELSVQGRKEELFEELHNYMGKNISSQDHRRK